ncbi:MAG: hypothetical protein ACLQQ4_14410 [Bacteroidia bacterium]
MQRFISIITFLLSVAYCLQVKAQAADTAIVPASVKNTFLSIYPHATNINWSRSSSFSNDNVKYVYRVKFRLGDYVICATTDSACDRFAEFSHEAYVPEEVWTKLNKMLPGVEITDCTTGSDTVKVPVAGKAHYSVMFTYTADSSNYEGSVILDSLYNVLEIWKDIPPKKLPGAITKYIKQNFKDYSLSEEEGSLLIDENGHTSYFISLDIPKNGGSYWLFFDSKGNLTKKEAHKWKTTRL